MKRLIIGGIAALAVGLVGAPVAGADPYTAEDLEFVQNLATIGYWDADKDRLIKTGHVVCQLLDDGESEATVNAEIIIHHGGDSYETMIFTRYAALAYCPWQPIAQGEL